VLAREGDVDAEKFLAEVGGVVRLLRLFQASLDEAGDEEQRDELRSAVERVLASAAGPRLVMSAEVAPFLAAGLESPSEELVSFVLRQLRCVAASEAEAARFAASPLQQRTLSLLRNPSPAIGEEAARTLLAVATTCKGAARPVLQQAAALVAASDAVVALRGLDLAVRIAVTSADSFAAFRESGLMERLAAMAATPDDALLALNALELLGALAACLPGMQFVVSAPVLGKLVAQQTATLEEFVEQEQRHQAALRAGERVRPGQEPRLDAVVLQGVLGLVQQLGVAASRLRFTQWIAEPALERLLQLSLDALPPGSLAAQALTTLCALASAPEGLLALAHQRVAAPLDAAELARSLLWRVPEFVSRAQDDVRLAALHGLAVVFAIGRQPLDPAVPVPRPAAARGGEALPAPAAQVLECLWQQVPFDLLHELLRRPFLDARMATLRLLAEALAHPFSLTESGRAAWVLDYLLDRGNESTKLGAELKFAALHAASRNAALQTLPAETRTRVAEYVAQGVFFAPGGFRGDPKVQLEAQ
jgi:hypothetical protein